MLGQRAKQENSKGLRKKAPAQAKFLKKLNSIEKTSTYYRI